jgi:uncharacterized protein YraI
MARSFYTSHYGVMFVAPGGQSENGPQIAQAGYKWCAINVADGDGWDAWSESIRQFRAQGMRVPVWGRVQNMPLESIMDIAIRNHVPVILNIEDEFKATPPAIWEQRIKAVKAAHPTYTREIVISTVGWVYNDVNYLPIGHRPVLLQVFPSDMHRDPSELPLVTPACIAHAKQKGWRDVGVTFQTYADAQPSWYDFYSRAYSLFHGDGVGAQSAWNRWAV